MFTLGYKYTYVCPQGYGSDQEKNPDPGFIPVKGISV